MSDALPLITIVRHGETQWSRSGQHTGLTDLPLTPRGEDEARLLGTRLEGESFARVFTSPLQRARRTCELAGFGAAAAVNADLAEWNYGQYEGLRSSEILDKRPDWQLFRDGCPGGESPNDVARRADRVLTRIRSVDGNVLVFSSGHIGRMLAARWTEQPPPNGRYLFLDTASVSALGYEHLRLQPVIRLWNDTRHLASLR